MEQKKPFKERRKYARLKDCVEVKYTVIDKLGKSRVFTKNISAGGICLAAEEELAPDTPLKLEIKLPDLKDLIHALGRVVWQKVSEGAGEKSETHFDTGIEFTGISDFDRFNINRYVIERIESGE